MVGEEATQQPPLSSGHLNMGLHAALSGPARSMACILNSKQRYSGTRGQHQVVQTSEVQPAARAQHSKNSHTAAGRLIVHDGPKLKTQS